jgi:hypothetical protein
VPLRDLDQYHDWVRRESPSATAQRVALDFLVRAGRESWLAPSVPILDLSNQPIYEVRRAQLPVSDEDDVRIWYRHSYEVDDVDVIAVTQLEMGDTVGPGEGKG